MQCQFFDMDSCNECHTHWFNYSGYMSFPDCCQKCENDAEFSAAWTRSMKATKGEVDMDAKSGSVSDDKSFRRVFRKSYLCLNKSQFTAKYKHSPAELQVKPSDIIDEKGVRRAVYVLENPNRPGFEMDIERVEEIKESSGLFGGKLFCDDTLKEWYNKGKKDFDDDFQKKVFNKATTEEDIEAKVAELASKRNFAALVAKRDSDAEDSEADESDGSDNDDEKADDDDQAEGELEEADAKPDTAGQGRKMPPPPAPEPSPAKRQKLQTSITEHIKPQPSPAKSVLSSRKGRSFCSPAGGATSIGGDSDDEADTTEPARTAPEHIRKLNIVRILAGSKIGQHRRNAEDFIKNNPGAPDLDLLQERIDLARKCTAMHRNGIVTLEKVVVDETCKLLKDAQISIPTVAKEYILDRAINDWRKDPLCATKFDEVIRMAVPWRESSDDQDVDMCDGDFDPTAPQVAALDSSDLEKASRFGDILVKSILTPMLKQGAGSLTSVIEFSKKVIDKVVSIPEEAPELFGEIAGEILVCFRALLVMHFFEGDECCDGTHADYEDLTKPPKSFRLAASLNASIKAAPFWKGLKEDYLKYKVVNETNGPAFKTLQAEMKECKSPMPPAKLQKFVVACADLKAQLAPGRCDTLYDTLKTEIEMHSKNILAKAEAKTLVEVQSETITEFLSLFDSVAKFMGYVNSAEGARSALMKELAARDNMGKVRIFVDSCMSLKANLLDEALVTDLLAKAEDCRGLLQVSSLDPDILSVVNSTTDTVLKEVCTGVLLRERPDDVNRLVRVLSFFSAARPKSAYELDNIGGLSAVIQILSSAVEAISLMKKLQGLGEDDAVRARAANGEDLKVAHCGRGRGNTEVHCFAGLGHL